MVCTICGEKIHIGKKAGCRKCNYFYSYKFRDYAFFIVIAINVASYITYVTTGIIFKEIDHLLTSLTFLFFAVALYYMWRSAVLSIIILENTRINLSNLYDSAIKQLEKDLNKTKQIIHDSPSIN